MKKIIGRRIFFILIFIILIFFLIFWLSFRGNLWRYYPLAWQEKIAWNKLKASSYNDPLCHEDCLSGREVQKKIILAYYEKNQAKVLEEIKDALLNKNENENFKIELVKLVADLNQDNQLDFSYLDKYEFSQTENNFRAALAQYLGIDSFADLEEIKENVFNDSLSLTKRYDNLVLLSRLEREPDFSFYESLINNEKEISLRKRAITNILYQANPSAWLSEKIVVGLEKIIADQNQDLELQKIALWLLVENPDKKRLINFLSPIFSDQKRDKFLRSYIFDYINELEPNKYQEPEIKPAEWAEYEKKLINN
jgi:hypothetical protein